MDKEMSKKKVLSILIGAMLVIAIVCTFVVYTKPVVDNRQVLEDLNILQNNDYAMAQYIQQNSTAITQLQELSKSCVILEDTNYSQTIKCTIVKK